MTPQQKLERLKEIALEAKELLSSMHHKDLMRVTALNITSNKSQILLSDERDMLILYPDCHVEQIESEYHDTCLTKTEGGIEYVTFGGSEL